MKHVEDSLLMGIPWPVSETRKVMKRKFQSITFPIEAIPMVNHNVLEN